MFSLPKESRKERRVDCIDRRAAVYELRAFTKHECCEAKPVAAKLPQVDSLKILAVNVQTEQMQSRKWKTVGRCGCSISNA